MVATGFQADAGKFFLFLLAVVFQNLAVSGIVYSMAAGIGVFAAAQTLLNMFVIFAMVRTYVCVCVCLSAHICTIWQADITYRQVFYFTN